MSISLDSAYIFNKSQLYCTFDHSLKGSCPIDCTINQNTYYELKKKIQQQEEPQGHEINRWTLYHLGRVLDKDHAFIPSDNDSQLARKLIIQSTEPKSSDSEIDIIIVVKNQPAFAKKNIINEFSISGTRNITYYALLFHLKPLLMI